MEGLIPFVLHALKKKRERSKYSSLKEGSSHSCRHPLTENVVGFNLDGSSHRRTRSDFQTPASGFVGWGGSSSTSNFSAWNGMGDSSQQKQLKNIEMNGKQSQKA